MGSQVLPAIRQRRHSRPYPSRSWYSIKRPWSDARLSWPSMSWPQTLWRHFALRRQRRRRTRRAYPAVPTARFPGSATRFRPSPTTWYRAGWRCTSTTRRWADRAVRRTEIVSRWCGSVTPTVRTWATTDTCRRGANARIQTEELARRAVDSCLWQQTGPILRNFSGCTISKVHVWCNALTLSRVSTSYSKQVENNIIC